MELMYKLRRMSIGQIRLVSEVGLMESLVKDLSAEFEVLSG